MDKAKVPCAKFQERLPKLDVCEECCWPKNAHKQVTDYNREEILRIAVKYLKHADPFVRILAQIAIYHYGDK